jgi:hypothetical protein
LRDIRDELRDIVDFKAINDYIGYRMSKRICRQRSCTNKAHSWNLCSSHLEHQRQRGLIPPAKVYVSREEVLDTWCYFMKAVTPDMHITTADIAEMLGMQVGALQFALHRARVRGDARAIRHPVQGRPRRKLGLVVTKYDEGIPAKR